MKTIILNDIRIREILITKNGSFNINLLFQRLDDTGAVHDTKRIVLTEEDFTPTQITKFNDILGAIISRAKIKEEI